MHRSGTCVRHNGGAELRASLSRPGDAVIRGPMSRVAAPILSVALAAFAQMALAPGALAGPHDALIAKHAAANGVPEQLIRRVIRIESRGNAGAVHAGNYGLMQIRLGTARGVGYSGDAQGLLDPDTNLTYAVKYLAGAYRAAGCDADRAVSYYQRGYYGAALRECAESPRAFPLTQIARSGNRRMPRSSSAMPPRRRPTMSSSPRWSAPKRSHRTRARLRRDRSEISSRSGWRRRCRCSRPRS